MSAPPIGSVGGASPVSSSTHATSPKTNTASNSGNNVFAELIKSANQQQIDADKAVENLANGGNQSLHGAVLSAARADLSFRLVLEMRNKLTDAYQEIMRMQV